MKKILTRKITICLQLTFLTALFAGCEKAAIQFGQTYIGTGVTNIVLVDSMTVGVSNVYKDSVVTSGQGAILLGTATDPYFGKTTSTTYLSLVPSTNTLPDFLPNATYDSLVLLMKSNTDYYGDTLSSPVYSIQQLTSEILLPDQQFSFFNTSSFPFNPTIIGSRQVYIRPTNGDSVNVRLDDTKGLGQKLFGMLRRKSDTLKTNTSFTNFFKGLRLTASGANVIYGLKDSVVLRLYYHETDVLYTGKTFDFTLNNNNFQFNNISYDRTGTPLTKLGPASKEVSSALTNNLGYSQAASGLYLKISFPTLSGLLQRPDYIKIINAQLIVKPYPGSFYGGFPLPPQLVAASTDALNEPGGVLSTTINGTAATETGDLFIDYLNGINTNYSYDVTNYLTAQISSLSTNFANGLLIIPPSGPRYSSLKRIMIGDSKNSNLNARVQLKVYYISVIH